MGLFKKKSKGTTQSIDYSIPVPPADAFKPIARAAVSEGISVNEYMKSHNVNSFNEPLDKLIDGDLPFGWVAYNKDIVQEIESEVSIYRAEISNAENSQDKLDALNEYMKFVREGKKRYAEKGECISKYFDEFVCKSEETKGNKEKLKRLKEQLKK